MTAHASSDPERPEVSVSTADTVVLELTPADAKTLARILAHYDVIARWARRREADGKSAIPVADGYDADVWQHVVVHLLAESDNAHLQISAPTVIVPFRTRGAHR